MINNGFPDVIKREIYDAQNGYCKLCFNPIHSIHHKLHDTEYNRKKYPLYIHSPFNGVGLCFKCHRDKSHLFRVSDKEAEVYEKWITNLK